MAISWGKPWCRYCRRRNTTPGCFRSRVRPPTRGDSSRRKFTGSHRHGVLSVNSPAKGRRRMEGQPYFVAHLMCIHCKAKWYRKWLVVRGQTFPKLSMFNLAVLQSPPEFSRAVHMCSELSPPPTWRGGSPVLSPHGLQLQHSSILLSFFVNLIPPPIRLGDPRGEGQYYSLLLYFQNLAWQLAQSSRLINNSSLNKWLMIT